MAAPDVLPSDMETTDMEVDPSTQQEKLQAAVVNAVQEHYRMVFAGEADQGLRKLVDPCEYLHASFPQEASKMQFIITIISDERNVPNCLRSLCSCDIA